MRLARLLPASVLLLACGSAPDARYPAQPAGCPIKAYPSEPPVPVDDLGVVQIDCGSAPRGGCEREAMDVVCRRGGDLAWGFAENALTSTRLVVHAAHTHRALEASREPGCAVQVFQDSPPMPTENVGPVTALCSTDDSRDVCLGALKDQVCRLGGDVLWQLDGPVVVDTSNGPRQRMRGRAAHVK